MSGNLPPEVRAHRTLRQRHEAFLREATGREAMRELETVLVDDCQHPVTECRLDGVWTIGPKPLACVTCTACGTSLSMSLRSDLETAITGGGSLAEAAGGASHG